MCISVLGIHWKEWIFFGGNDAEAETPIVWPPQAKSWHGKRPWSWCWEGLGAGREGDDRGWDGWMASPTRWTWVWVNSMSWWWTGKPGVLQFMGSQRVGHNWATEQNWTETFLSVQFSNIKYIHVIVQPSLPCFLKLCVFCAQSCLTLYDCSLLGFSGHGILQARILEQFVICSSRGSSQPKDRTDVSCISGISRKSLYHWSTWEAFLKLVFIYKHTVKILLNFSFA